MAPPQAIPIFGQMEDTSVQVSHLWSPGIWPRAPGLISLMTQGDSNCGRIMAPSPSPQINNGPGVSSNSGHILVLGVYSSPFRIKAHPQAIPILEC